MYQDYEVVKMADLAYLSNCVTLTVRPVRIQIGQIGDIKLRPTA